MASLSDQIDRFSRNTRSIKSTASHIATQSPQEYILPGVFTRAVLDTHLGDLIRDIDPSELGLFRLQNSSNKPYDKDGRTIQEPAVTRTEFTGATPLRQQTRREGKQEIEPEVYAHAALKYIEQYEPIRPMPRAYDQIVTVLNRLNAVRGNIESLNATLEQVSAMDKVPPAKIRVEQEERHIKELQARVAELLKKKETTAKQSNLTTNRPKSEQTQPSKDAPKAPPQPPRSPSSPLGEKFWTTPGEPSRVLRFSDNLLDEEVNLGDVSTGSFGSPPPADSSELRPLKLFGNVDMFDDEPTIMQYKVLDEDQFTPEEEKEVLGEERMLSPFLGKLASPETSPIPPQITLYNASDSREPTSIATETPTGTRQRKIKVNIEVERIVSKIWSTVGDIIMPHSRATGTVALPINETIEHLQQLASQSPQPESPIASTTSSISGESSAPTFQQIQTAYLLMTLLSASPHYSMPLSVIKDNLALKAKGSGVAAAGQGTTRVLFQCVAKRLLKIDRGGREQIVKFDI